MLGVSNAFLGAMYSPVIAYTVFSVAKGLISEEQKEKLKNYYIAKRYGFEKIDILKQQRRMALFVKQYNLFNVDGEFFDNISMKKIDRGMQIEFCIRGMCSFEQLLDGKSFFDDLFLCYFSSWENDRGNITIKAYTEKLGEENYEKIELSPYELLLGYNHEGQVLINMKTSPHLLISGLSNNGKSYQLRVILKNLVNKADIVVCNSFVEDYKDIKGVKLLNGDEAILEFLEDIIAKKEYREKPLYIVLEEMMSLKEKNIVKAIGELLAQARHWNIFFIGVIQIATKEQCKFKDLFNSRVTFKQVEASAYEVVLGCKTEKNLKPREFYTITQKGLEKGITYTLK